MTHAEAIDLACILLAKQERQDRRSASLNLEPALRDAMLAHADAIFEAGQRLREISGFLSAHNQLQPHTAWPNTPS